MKSYRGLTLSGFLLRLAAAFTLVFTTYNPSGTSYFHWVRDNIFSPTPLMVLLGIVLLIGWTIYLRATMNSLGAFGLFLAVAFFGAILWLVIDRGLVPADSVTAITYMILVIMCFILAVGISWSHIRRRITGQVDVDELEGDL